MSGPPRRHVKSEGEVLGPGFRGPDVVVSLVIFAGCIPSTQLVRMRSSRRGSCWEGILEVVAWRVFAAVANIDYSKMTIGISSVAHSCAKRNLR